MQVLGRQHPVSVYYVAMPQSDYLEASVNAAAPPPPLCVASVHGARACLHCSVCACMCICVQVTATLQIHVEEKLPGDILVFLTGQMIYVVFCTRTRTHMEPGTWTWPRCPGHCT